MGFHSILIEYYIICYYASFASTQSNDAPPSTPYNTSATSSSSSKKKSSRRKSYSTPIAIDATCPPSAYQYTVKMSDGLVKVVPASSLRLACCCVV